MVCREQTVTSPSHLRRRRSPPQRGVGIANGQAEEVEEADEVEELWDRALEGLGALGPAAQSLAFGCSLSEVRHGRLEALMAEASMSREAHLLFTTLVGTLTHSRAHSLFS